MRHEILAEGVELFNADCRDVLPTLGKIDACVTDPPYGIPENVRKAPSRGRLTIPKDYGMWTWDNVPADTKTIEFIRSCCDWQIIFGGNFFELPPSSCWLVWDKMNTGDFADCELAWTNLPKAVRRIRYLWNGCMRRERDIERVHPTQKPVGVMTWCLDHLPADVRTVCDPFAGSGTTGVACVQKGLQFIGIEKHQPYFDAACRRISAALAAPQLFADPVASLRQEALL